MPYPDALGHRPLEVREAYEALAQYAADYGRAPLILLLHAAVPETLRPDLLNLIRVNFVADRGGDPSLDADVLFSPLTTALGGGYYRIDPQVRWHCLALLRSLHRDDPRPRTRRVAELLWRYVEALEHRASRAADPQLAEFLDIQRWVALAFLEPAGAAHAFAEALQQAAETRSSVALRLGGLTSAIEIPLAGQPELLAYARGMDALSGGNEDDARRILGALGDGEIRIGGVLLKAPTQLLAERLATPAAGPEGAAAPPRRTCFVIIGFGQKTDYASGRVLDLDQSYAMIRHAVAALGMDCARADELPASAIVAAIFRRIVAADLVIYDLSTRDAGVLYLLGVGLALRPAGTLVVAETGFAEATFSALIPRVDVRYAFAGKAITADEQERFARNTRLAVEAATPAPLTSPVYARLPLQPPLPGTGDAPPAAGTGFTGQDSGACLVLQGVGVKVDEATGRSLDLDASYAVIRDAVRGTGLRPVRVDEIGDAGTAVDAILELLLNASLVIADLSAAVPEVLLHLGIRHGLRPARTLLIAEKQFTLPAELASLPVLRYQHLGTDLGRREAERFGYELGSLIKATMATSRVDSPVYLALPDLEPPKPPRAPEPQASDEAAAETPHRPLVFISYVHEYRVYASPLADALRRAGIAVASDMDLRAGDGWAEELASMLERADAVIALAGSLTRGRSFPLDEIQRAEALGKRLFPVFVDAISEPEALLRRQCANYDAKGKILHLGSLQGAALDEAIALTARNIVEALRRLTAGENAFQEEVAAGEAERADAPAADLRVVVIRRQGEDGLQFIVVGEAREEWFQRFQPALVSRLLGALHSGWTALNVDAARTLAELLVPSGLRELPPVARYHIVVAQEAAALPWELLLGIQRPDFPAPLAVLRRLDGLHASPVRVVSRENNALLIGNPRTAGTLPEMEQGLPSLPGAAAEVAGVASVLQQAGLATRVYEDSNAADVMGALFARPYRVLLISGAAVRDHILPDGRRVTGFVLSDGIFLTAVELRQLSSAPEVVFLNGCHAGQIADVASQPAGDFAAPMVTELLRAGVACVVAPAWSIDDRIAELFSRQFFTLLVAGLRFEDACAQARRAAYDAAPGTSTWAAYQAWGDPDYVLQTPRRPTGNATAFAA